MASKVVGPVTSATEAASKAYVDAAAGIRKVTATVGGSTAQVITHNLGTRDVLVQLYQTAAPYAGVLTGGDTPTLAEIAATYDTLADLAGSIRPLGIERTTTDTVTVRFPSAPPADTYRAVIVG